MLQLKVENHLQYPQSISQERIKNLMHDRKISKEISEIDLEMVKMKLRDPDEGLGWTEEQCMSAEVEYKRYLELCKKNGKGIVPNSIMDSMWHYHILDTIAYQDDCNKVFGGYLHHYPYFGMRGEEDASNLESAFLKTKDLYLSQYGEDLAREEHNGCWHDCQSRCWNACKSN